MHIIQEVTNWTGKPVVLLKALDAGDTCTSRQKSMNASEKKGDQCGKVRRKRKSREEAREDEILAKRIMIEGGDIKRNERQEADLQKFQEGRPEITM